MILKSNPIKVNGREPVRVMIKRIDSFIFLNHVKLPVCAIYLMARKIVQRAELVLLFVMILK